MSANEIHVGDIGTQFIITVTDNTAVDISTATTKQFIFKKPDGTKLTVSASFYSDGTDGKLTYTTVDGDIDIAGTWKLQTLVVISDGTFYSDVTTFKVYSNL